LNKTETVPVSVLDQVEVPPNVNGNSEIFVSKGGGLLTTRGRRSSKLAWFALNGLVTPVSDEVRSFGAPRLSPDEQSIAVAVGEQGSSAIWLYDMGNKTFSKLTSAMAANSPIWSPDGQRVYFVGLESSRFGVYVQNADGGSEPRLILQAPNPIAGIAVTPDEKSILVTILSDNSWRIFHADLADPKPKPYLNTRADQWAISISPDGKWIVMTSSESGRDEIVVRSYPNPSARIQISAGGGADPRWAPDGNSIYYTRGTTLIKATLSKSPSLRVIARDTVFRTMSSAGNSGLTAQYDLSRSGRVLGRTSESGDYQLIAVPNWKAELERKLAAAERH
jgi:Tol biopolymer transport system component